VNTVYGKRPVTELLRGNRTVERILLSESAEEGMHDRVLRNIIYLAKDKGIPIQSVPQARLDALTRGGCHQGVLALTREGPEYVDPEEIIELATERGEAPFLVILDQVQDPRNLGAVLRTAEVAGVHGVVIPKRRAAGLTGGVTKVAAGAEEHLKLSRVSNISQTIRRLKERGVWIVGSEAEQGHPFWELDFTIPVALVLGNEAKGISDVVKKECDFLVSIPVRGKVDSLNVSVAAGIVIYEVVRQRLNCELV
jgi:23S rRNA (guanosine2251-2'-O)-methyltransferase